MFCPKCGKENIDSAAFCAGCGAGLAGTPRPAKKTNLGLAAGIIDIAAGCLSLVSALFVAVFLFFMVGNEQDIPGFVALIPLAMVIPSVLSIVGGIFALRRRNWGMALTGSIALVITSTIPGVAALVLTIMAKDEFQQ